MRRRLSQVLAVVFSLAVVGLLTSSLPEFVPDQFFIRPNSAGVASTKDVTATLIGVETATAVRVVRDGSDDRTLETDDVLVLARVKMVAHGRTFTPVLTFVTADGYTYTDLEQFGFPGAAQVFVGEYNITTYLFEVPRDKVRGGYVGVSAPPGVGVQPVRPVIRYDVGDPRIVDGEVTLPPTEKGVVS